jgi:peptide deformylase
MAILEILQFPHEVLKKESAPVEGVNPALERLVRDMIETMYHAPGSGLAAAQVGVSKRLIVADATSADEEPQTIVIVNPRIVSLSPETEKAKEGCLSVPDFTAELERAVRVIVTGHDLSGEELEIEAEGWLARVFQHEIDHTNGILYIDRLGRLKRQNYVRKRKKALAAPKTSKP